MERPGISHRDSVFSNHKVLCPVFPASRDLFQADLPADPRRLLSMFQAR